MAFNETAYNETPVLGDDVLAYSNLDYWVFIDDQLESHVADNSINIQLNIAQNSTCHLIILNPDTNAESGKTIQVVYRGALLFAGIIRTATVTSDQSEAVLQTTIEADGWLVLLSRKRFNQTYSTPQLCGSMISQAFTDAGLTADGITLGHIDAGVTILFMDAKYVRFSDFLHDLGQAGGGLAYIDNYKAIQFYAANTNHGAILVENDIAETIDNIGDLDNYRNRQIVKATGADGVTTYTTTRNNLAEQTLRQVDEGGSGIYEDYVEITHPTSSVLATLQEFAESYAFITLRTYARNARRIKVKSRTDLANVGELVTVDLPGFNLAGEFITMRKTINDEVGRLIFTFEFWESSFQQMALESLLQIVGAAKSSIALSQSVFPNLQSYTVPGTYTFTVPGGVTTIQAKAIGGGGGGSGGAVYTGLQIPPPANGIVPARDAPLIENSGTQHTEYSFGTYGGKGSKSGIGLTIFDVTPGTDITVVVGAGGAAGTSDSNVYSVLSSGSQSTTATLGADGGDSTVTYAAVLKCRGDKGLKSSRAGLVTITRWSQQALYNMRLYTYPGADNLSKPGGVGDAVTPGAGNVGGKKGTGVPFAQPGAGVNGIVELRW